MYKPNYVYIYNGFSIEGSLLYHIIGGFDKLM